MAPDRRHGFRADTRGVKWTLQAYLFLVVLLGGIVIAAGSVPTTGGPTEFTDLQREQTAEDLLSTTSGTGHLEAAVKYWDARNSRWVGADGGADDTAYTTLTANTAHPLWPAFDTTFTQRQFATNVNVYYQVDTDDDGTPDGRRSQRVIYQGPPGRDAITARETVFLRDRDVTARGPTSADGDPCTLGELTGTAGTGTNGCSSGAFFASDAAPRSARYNVVEVRITIWSA